MPRLPIAYFMAQAKPRNWLMVSLAGRSRSVRSLSKQEDVSSQTDRASWCVSKEIAPLERTLIRGHVLVIAAFLVAK